MRATTRDSGRRDWSAPARNADRAAGGGIPRPAYTLLELLLVLAILIIVAGAVAPSVLAMMGTLEAVGCEELLTLDPPVDYGKWRLKITRIRLNATK